VPSALEAQNSALQVQNSAQQAVVQLKCAYNASPGSAGRLCNNNLYEVAAEHSSLLPGFAG